MASRVIFIMGVAGSGKSTVGKLLADQLDIPFYDGDDFHSKESIAKMEAGIPLEDADRAQWLKDLHTVAVDLSKEQGGVIACSALKEVYRGILSESIVPHCKWVLLDGHIGLIRERMQGREGHFMPAELLASQFDTLEIPPYAHRIPITTDPEIIVSEIMDSLTEHEIGIIGLGVMGKGLASNLAEKGFTLFLYNRHVPDEEEEIANKTISQRPELYHAQGFDDLSAFVRSMRSPRRILLMVEAGKAVDEVLDKLVPLLSPGDILADCGNSHYEDTRRRAKALENRGLHFIGTGISGGETGARFGPAIMPGGSHKGYAALRIPFEAIAARDHMLKPCVAYFGADGAGHFVKMVHNGIEYAEMQLIAEVYSILRHACGFTPDDVAREFSSWNEGESAGYLLEITAAILQQREGEGWLVDSISEVAKSKGTGAWTVQAAEALGVPSPVIAAAVHARYVTGFLDSGQKYAGKVDTPDTAQNHPTPESLRQAYQLARIVNHHLGFELLRAASTAYAWEINLREVARVWLNGCIIRSRLMQSLLDILPEAILSHGQMLEQAKSSWDDLTDMIVFGSKQHLHMPCHHAALNFLNVFMESKPTGNLIQAQRDYFGAHGYERVDDSSGTQYHTEWNKNEN